MLSAPSSKVTLSVASDSTIAPFTITPPFRVSLLSAGVYITVSVEKAAATINLTLNPACGAGNVTV